MYIFWLILKNIKIFQLKLISIFHFKIIILWSNEQVNNSKNNVIYIESNNLKKRNCITKHGRCLKCLFPYSALACQ